MKCFVLIAGVSLAGTDKLASAMPFMNEENGVTLALWFVGGLLSIIACLMGAMCKLAWDSRKENREDHKDIYNRMENSETGLEPRVTRLEAYDAGKMKGLMEEAVTNALKARREENGK